MRSPSKLATKLFHSAFERLEHLFDLVFLEAGRNGFGGVGVAGHGENRLDLAC